MYLSTEFFAAEASELHEWLTDQGVPRNKYSKNGQLMDETGKKYYILPLIDRVLLYGDMREAGLEK